MRRLKRVIRYLYRNYFLPKYLSYKNKDILSSNIILKDKYIGKRCFIVGGGPSVKEIDLSSLKNEFTFVVAEFDKNPQYKILVPKFHILSDSTYFTEGESEHWNQMFENKDKVAGPDTTFFLNLGAKQYVDKKNLFPDHKYYYIGTQGIISENFDFNIELDKYIPWPKNSVLLCMIIAVYLGFNEIYLLGCEHNFLCFNIGQGQGKSLAYSHNYKDELSNIDNANDQVVKKFAVPRDLAMNYEENVAHVLQLFKNYRLFYKKVRKIHPEIKIYNATPDSYLDVFPMIKFEEISGLAKSKYNV